MIRLLMSRRRFGAAHPHPPKYKCVAWQKRQEISPPRLLLPYLSTTCSSLPLDKPDPEVGDETRDDDVKH